jgi:peptidoglycan L-alanyl-D-glutamate endopeptidase CwlK
MQLSSTSLLHLTNLHPSLVAVVQSAASTTTQQFGVLEGLRTTADQLAAYRRHASKLNGYPIGSKASDGSPGTGIGKHQIQPDGFGHAVDLVPLINGQYRWEWPAIYLIAESVRAAARELSTPIRWGGVWDRRLNDLPDPLSAAVHSYTVRHNGPDFLDGPHYELHET